MLFSRLNPSGQMRLTGQASNSNSGAPAMDELMETLNWEMGAGAGFKWQLSAYWQVTNSP